MWASLCSLPRAVWGWHGHSLHSWIYSLTHKCATYFHVIHWRHRTGQSPTSYTLTIFTLCRVDVFLYLLSYFKHHNLNCDLCFCFMVADWQTVQDDKLLNPESTTPVNESKPGTKHKFFCKINIILASQDIILSALHRIVHRRASVQQALWGILVISQSCCLIFTMVQIPERVFRKWCNAVPCSGKPKLSPAPWPPWLSCALSLRDNEAAGQLLWLHDITMATVEVRGSITNSTQ